MRVTDVYLPEGQPLRALIFPGPRRADSDPRLLLLAEVLDTRARDARGDAFTVRAGVPAADGEGIEESLFRCQRATTLGETLLIFRRLAKEPPRLETLLPRVVVDVLLHRNLCSGGLLVVCGGPGQGKTTTLAATVAGRFRAHGGVCVTAEDPPEIPLQGRHGDGLCLQMEVRGEFPLEHAIHAALRMFPVGAPSIILIGEVRSRAAADEALNAALNGTLVCMTLHAASPVEALHRLVGLTGEGALQALSASLRVILNQRLRDGVMHVKPLVVPLEGGEQMRNNIRSGRFELLASDLQFQARQLGQGKPIAV